MMYNVAQFVTRALIFLTVVVLASARPQHFGETNQVTNDQDAGTNEIASAGLTNAQLEILAQRLAEYNNQIPSGWDPRWERIVRAPEIKRQSRFRQCYFNPVSCFKK